MPKPSKYEELSKYVRGYPKLAGQMAMLPEIAIFRRFGALNARNLLYLQAELTDLEVALMNAETRDSRHPKWEKQAHSKDWYWIAHSVHADDEDRVQYNLVVKIREKLDEYNKALCYQAFIHQLHKSDHFDLRDIQAFMASDGMELPLIAEDANTWGTWSKPDSFTKDGLVTLRPRQRTDAFSSKLSEYGVYVLGFITRLFTKRPTGKVSDVVEGYQDSTVSKVTFWLTSFIASSMPVLSIIALVNISSLKVRLAAIAGFNGLVSLCLVWFTEARRIDVFAITAAFAAVQVVFVGQALESGPKEVIIAGARGEGCMPCLS